MHGIYLEDLYVRPAARGTGLGKALLVRSPRSPWPAATPGWSGRYWTGTTPSIDFYRALGAVPMDGWTIFRLTMPAPRRVPSSPSSD